MTAPDGSAEEAALIEHQLLDVGAIPSPPRRNIVMRLVMLVITAVSLYFFLPSIISVLSSWDRLNEVNPIWLLVIFAAEAASFGCVWMLQRLALRTKRWFAVATSQLSGNAFSRVVPGGAAAGVAIQMKMLTEAGVNTTTAASGLTAVSLLTTGIVFALPVLALPAILTGTPVDKGLESAAMIGVGVFFILVIVIGFLLFRNGPIAGIGRFVQRIQNWIRSRRHQAPVTDLPERLTVERDLIRRTLQEGWWIAVLAAAGRSLFDYLALLAALVAVGAQPNPSLVLLAYVAATVLAMIPITPGGLGFVEAGLTATLALAGVNGQEAVLATLAYRLASYWLPLPAGLASWALFRRRYANPSAPNTSTSASAPTRSTDEVTKGTP